jgi:hypothetical protein
VVVALQPAQLDAKKPATVVQVSQQVLDDAWIDPVASARTIVRALAATH